MAASSGATVVRFFTAGDFLGADVRVSSFRAGLAWRGRVWATADVVTTARQSDIIASLYEAVDAAVNLDFVKVPGRKAIVLFTDGVDTTSRRASFESSIIGVEEVDALIYSVRYDTQEGGRPQAAALQGIGVPQHMINTLARGTARSDYERGREYLSLLAESSGGRMFEAGEINLETSFKNVAEELRRQYAVGYYPDDTGQAGDRRKIKVQVSRPGAVVRSKSAYVIKDRDGEMSDSDN